MSSNVKRPVGHGLPTRSEQVEDPLDQQDRRRREQIEALQYRLGYRQRGTPIEKIGQVGRNDPCPCGSKKKFKHCHLKESVGRTIQP